jgi:hypothetical protein
MAQVSSVARARALELHACLGDKPRMIHAHRDLEAPYRRLGDLPASDVMAREATKLDESPQRA